MRYNRPCQLILIRVNVPGNKMRWSNKIGVYNMYMHKAILGAAVV